MVQKILQWNNYEPARLQKLLARNKKTLFFSANKEALANLRAVNWCIRVWDLEGMYVNSSRCKFFLLLAYCTWRTIMAADWEKDSKPTPELYSSRFGKLVHQCPAKQTILPAWNSNAILKSCPRAGTRAKKITENVQRNSQSLIFGIFCEPR